jgi:hypothetical protein
MSSNLSAGLSKFPGVSPIVSGAFSAIEPCVECEEGCSPKECRVMIVGCAVDAVLRGALRGRMWRGPCSDVGVFVDCLTSSIPMAGKYHEEVAGVLTLIVRAVESELSHT